jgi:hypothetical protein
VIIAIAVHGVVLVGDSVLHPSLVERGCALRKSFMRLARTLGSSPDGRSSSSGCPSISATASAAHAGS